MNNTAQVRVGWIPCPVYYGALVIVLLLLAASSPAFAGGFFLYELGTPDVGLASAGYTARAQDASTVFTNPAGMTMLDH